MAAAKENESSFSFFKNLAKKQGMSMGGCAVGLLVGLFLAYQVLSLLVWLVSKVLGFGAVMVCSRCPCSLTCSLVYSSMDVCIHTYTGQGCSKCPIPSLFS
jgi:hypothetical protein